MFDYDIVYPLFFRIDIPGRNDGDAAGLTMQAA